jgi:hypothetical protein
VIAQCGLLARNRQSGPALGDGLSADIAATESLPGHVRGEELWRISKSAGVLKQRKALCNKLVDII